MSTATLERWNVDSETYHADHRVIGNSMLRVFRRSPQEYEATYVSRTITPKETEAKNFGKAFHEAMQDPTAFLAKIWRKPDIYAPENEPLNRRKPAHREWEAQQIEQARAAGRLVVESDEPEKILAMSASVWKNPEAKQAMLKLPPNHQEYAVKWQDDDTGLWCKSMADFWIPDGMGTVVDFKTTLSWQPWAFKHEARRYQYAHQAAWYLDAFDCWRHLIIAIHKEPPFECVVYEFSRGDIDNARKENRDTLREIAAAHASGYWASDAQSEIVQLALPSYAWSDE